MKIYSIHRSAHLGTSEELVAALCGSHVPGPVLSGFKASALKVVFYSDADLVSNGFRANYEFIGTNPMNESEYHCANGLTTQKERNEHVTSYH